MSDTAPLTIIDAIDQIWSDWFKDRATWFAWFVFLKALFGMPMTPDELRLYQECTGRSAPPAGGVFEAWLVVGRRGGKSLILALIACYLAICRDWSSFLAPGERGTILIVATDKRTARTIFRYCRALIGAVWRDHELEGETAETIDLPNRITIEIVAANYRTIRGRTLVAGLVDEIAFLPTDETAALPDAELINAMRPAMATVPNAVLLCASSPYAKRGALWTAFRKYHGVEDAPVLVWQAATRIMNPSVPQRVIDDAIELDPASAAAEFGAEFRSDVEAFISREVVDAAVVPGLFEIPKIASLNYFAFTDPAGGSGADAMTLAIGARAPNGTICLCAVREIRPRFSPEAAVAELAAVIKSYGCSTVTGDRFAGEWPRERFAAHGIEYLPAEKPKSDLYREFLPLLNAGQVELLDYPRLITQLCGLERRVARGGRDSIDHPSGQHDDVANAVAGMAVLAATGAGRGKPLYFGSFGSPVGSLPSPYGPSPIDLMPY